MENNDHLLDNVSSSTSASEGDNLEEAAEQVLQECRSDRKTAIETFIGEELQFLTVKCLDYHLSVQVYEDEVKAFDEKIRKRQRLLSEEAKTVNKQYKDFFQGLLSIDPMIETRKSEEVNSLTKSDPLLSTDVLRNIDETQNSLKQYSEDFKKKIVQVSSKYKKMHKKFDRKQVHLKSESKKMIAQNKRFVKLMAKLRTEKY